MAKRDRFLDAGDWLICPVCGDPLSFCDASLSCPSRHSFDVARQGYVNLLSHARTEGHYSAEVLQRREEVLEAGYYDHILAGVSDALSTIEVAGGVLDAGCGTGFYTRRLAADHGRRFVAADIVKEGIRLGAALDQGESTMWMVGDSAGLPVADSCMAAVLDIFAPANYDEFDRVLAPGGCVIKVLPGPDHVRELREAAASALHRAEHTDGLVFERFCSRYELVADTSCSATLPVDGRTRDTFIEMTPLLFHVDSSRVDFSAVDRITVSGRILVGLPPSH